MKNNYSYLNDMDFLKKITSLPVLEYFAKIDILNWDQQLIDSIEGRVMQANFSIDGNSIIRRTGNITLTLNYDEIFNRIKHLFSINKKVYIEIGFKNHTDKYEQFEILWFPLGLYIIWDPSITHSVSTITISLQLKDKMCLLNGDCGGTLPSSVVFDNYSTIDENGMQVINRPTIYQIIRQLVNHFGGEQLSKIIISDLDIRVKQVVKWMGNVPLYFVQKNGQYKITINENEYLSYIRQQHFTDVTNSPFSQGQNIGYVYTDFTYPGDLIGNAGQAVTDILEKIKQTLGNYEYFYDLNGNFVFQQIKNYLNNTQAKYVLESLNNGKFVPDYISSLYTPGDAYKIDINRGKSVFAFDDSNLIISYSNNPLYSMIKNDFIVWGKRKAEDQQTPIRYHLAIDEKPKVGNTYQVFKYIDPKDDIEKWHCPIKFPNKSSFPQRGAEGVFYMDTSQNKIYKWGITTEIEQDSSQTIKKYDYLLLQGVSLQNVTTKDWRTQLYFQGVVAEPYGTESNFYYTELLNEWPKIYNILPDSNTNGSIVNNSGFKSQFIKNPSKLDFFLDFIDSSSEAGEFSISNIGRRTLVLNENDVNCVFQSYIPDVILLNIDSADKTSYSLQQLKAQCQARNQDYYQVSNQIYANIEFGGFLNSGYQTVRQLIHQYTSYNNNITIQTLPMFFFQPNTRITVNDQSSDIHGDYIINQMSFSLEASSTLTINAKKALQKI